jgi:hypothetical protein
MLKRIIIILAILFAALGVSQPAHAVTPTISNVVKTRLYTGAYTYTATIDHATSVTGVPRDSAYWPTATGGCVVSGHTNPRNHARILDGIACASPGTVSFRTKPTYDYSCGTFFTLTAADGLDVSTYSDALTGECPPPPPPAVITLIDGDSVGFLNTAEVDQLASYGRTVPNVGCVYVSDSPITTQTSTRFAGTGPNTYVYYWAFVQANVPAGGLVIATLVCPV